MRAGKQQEMQVPEAAVWTSCLIPSENEIIHMLTSREWEQDLAYILYQCPPAARAGSLPRTRACPPLPSRAVLSLPHLLSWSGLPTGPRSLSHSPSSLPLLPSNPRCRCLGAQGQCAELRSEGERESQHQCECGQPLRMCAVHSETEGICSRWWGRETFLS